MNEQAKDDVRAAVRERYGSVARAGSQTGCTPGGCCGPDASASLSLGYSSEELAAAPEAANMGLGCGNPQAIAALKPGETVLDLGAGGGLDCFLAAQRVGAAGRVIGVDMTPDMLSKARAAAHKLEAKNRVVVNEASRTFIRDWMPGSGAENYVASAAIEAVKPDGKACCG